MTYFKKFPILMRLLLWGLLCASATTITTTKAGAADSFAHSVHSTQFDLNALMGELGKHRNRQARFVEKRFVKKLEQPLVSEGTLSFVAPDHFERITLTPPTESIVIDGNQLLLKRGGRSRRLTLDASPESTAIIQAIRGTLSGDAPSLRNAFATQLEGTPEQWTLTLKPTEAQVAAHIARIDIGGRHDQIRRVEVQLANGDRSVMDIIPLDTDE